MASGHGSTRLASYGAVLATVCLAAVTVPREARADDDDLAVYRDRFRLGMEKYKEGSVGEAIRVWSAIYEELGTKRGYRLAFNLARAYDTNGEATRAAERYHAFLDEAAARRARGETLEPLVEREVHDAEERLADLNSSHGRIEIAAGPDATLAQIDDTDPRLGAFVAYVAPGRHVVTFGPGKADAEKIEVDVAAGEISVLHATRAPEPATRPGARLTVDPIFKRVTKHPFTPVVLYTGVVLTAGSVLAPGLAYSHAISIYDSYNASTSTIPERISARNAYPGASTVYYGLLAVPISLAAITGGLTTWYFAGAHEENVVVSIDATPGGGTLTARF
jgi:hypothetical protein